MSRNRLIGITVVWMLILPGAIGQTAAAAQETVPPCSPPVLPDLKPVDREPRTVALGRRSRIFSVRPIEYRVDNCRLSAKEWKVKVFGASLSPDEFSARLVAKSATTASIVFDKIDPRAFPAGSFDLTLAINETDLSFSAPISVTRQYTNWGLVAFAIAGACCLGLAILALRAAWASERGPREFWEYFKRFKNYAVLVGGIPAAWGVYKAQYVEAPSWEGQGIDFTILAITAGAAFIAGATAATAVSGAGAKSSG